MRKISHNTKLIAWSIYAIMIMMLFGLGINALRVSAAELSAQEIIKSLELGETESNYNKDLIIEPGQKTQTGQTLPNNSTGVMPLAYQNSIRQVSLDIPFDFDSAHLTSVAINQLNQLALALQSKSLTSQQFRLVGHTDASGSDSYNLALSQRRAKAVAAFLMQQFGVSRNRLSVSGMGERQLLSPDYPESAQNRRVQVINLGLVQ